MQYPIVVRAALPGEFVAQPLGMPELKVQAATEAEAVALVRRSLLDWLASVRLIQVDLPTSEQSNAWLDSFGRSANDPDFEEYEKELQRIREEANAR